MRNNDDFDFHPYEKGIAYMAYTFKLMWHWTFWWLQICIGIFTRECDRTSLLFSQKSPEKLRRYTPTKEKLVEHYLSINQHQSAFISINQHKSETFSVNQHQLASMSISQHQPVSVSIYQHINQHINQHSASINICNWIWNYIYWHKCSKFLRSVRKL